MNEIEKAISEIIGTNYGECQCHRETMVQAVEALREQAEMEKGCTHCQKPYVSIGGINEDKAIIYLGAERPYTKGNVEYLHHMDSAGRMNAFKVRHCPVCGRRLVDE